MLRQVDTLDSISAQFPILINLPVLKEACHWGMYCILLGGGVSQRNREGRERSSRAWLPILMPADGAVPAREGKIYLEQPGGRMGQGRAEVRQSRTIRTWEGSRIGSSGEGRMEGL